MKNQNNKRTRRRQKWNGEVVFRVTNVKIKCLLDEDVYTEDDRKKAVRHLIILSSEVLIDKSYVDFKESKFEKTFIPESEWNKIRDLVVRSNFGEKCSVHDLYTINQFFKDMLPNYFRMVFSDLGWDTDYIDFSISDDVILDVECMKDTSESWKTYVGKWQTWQR